MENKSNMRIKRNALQNFSNLKSNPLTNLLIKKYSKGSYVDVDALLQDLNGFINNNDLEFKLRYLFSVYDQNSDNLISSTELYEILKLLNNGVIENFKLQNIVDKTFAEIEEYTTEMNFDQFKNIIKKKCLNLENVFNCK